MESDEKHNNELLEYIGSVLVFGFITLVIQLLFSVNDVATFLIVGGICLFFNEMLAREITKLYILPIQWIFGRKNWVLTIQHFLFYWMRLTLYGGFSIALIVGILEFSA